jgi:hypothetical protein
MEELRSGIRVRATMRIKPRLRSIKLTVLSLVVLLATEQGAPSPMRDDAGGTIEYNVKAEFLFHFAQFVEWPAAAFESANSQLKYCTIGEDPFHGVLDDILKGRTVANRPLVVQHLTGPELIGGCQIVFIGAAEKGSFDEVLTRASGHAVLSVGETEQFTRDGGVIGLFVKNKRLCFNVNLDAAGRAKLKISSRILVLATGIIGNSE